MGEAFIEGDMGGDGWCGGEGGAVPLQERHGKYPGTTGGASIQEPGSYIVQTFRNLSSHPYARALANFGNEWSFPCIK
jgi:hypothetical protein